MLIGLAVNGVLSYAEAMDLPVRRLYRLNAQLHLMQNKQSPYFDDDDDPFDPDELPEDLW